MLITKLSKNLSADYEFPNSCTAIKVKYAMQILQTKKVIRGIKMVSSGLGKLSKIEHEEEYNRYINTKDNACIFRS